MPCKGHSHHGTGHKAHHSANTSVNHERHIAIRITMQPKDTNGRGKIFGGRMLELMDLAGAYAAHRVCKNRFIHEMVTRFTNGTEFRSPVEVNDAVTFYGKVTKVGNTSVTIQVEAEADRGGTIIPVLSSTMVFVALDKDGKPTPIMASDCDSAAEPAPVVAAPPTDATPDAPAKHKKCKCKDCACKKCKKGKCKKKCKQKCKCKSKRQAAKAERKCAHSHAS